MAKRKLNTTASEEYILVMGGTGVGKSTFINSVLNKPIPPMEVGYGQRSCTKHVMAVTLEIPSHINRHLRIVDTPGFDDDTLDDREVLRRIATWLTDASRDMKNVLGVIYLHDISRDTVSIEDIRSFEVFKKLCGDAFFRRIIIANTKGSRISEEELKRREHLLETGHWRTVVAGGASVRRFDIKNLVSAQEIVRMAAEPSDCELLQIQREIMEKRDIKSTQAYRIIAGGTRQKNLKSIFSSIRRIFGF